MAYPVIIFEQDNGADGNSASGAGPATAVTGSKARTSGSAARVGFFEASGPDISLVATDGSHAIKLGTGAGRQWSRITAKRDSTISTTGNMSGGSATISSTTTTGMVAGDLVRVTGAGSAGADLYSPIATVVNSTTVNLLDNASTPVTGAAVLVPKQVTLGDNVNLSADTAWAIGGQRSSIDGISQFWLDLKPGWTIELKDNAGGAGDIFPVTAQIVLTVSGDPSIGWITIRGAGKYRPTVSWDSTHVPFAIRASQIRIQGLQPSSSTKSLAVIDSSNAGDIVFDDCAGTSVSYLVEVTSAVTGGRFTWQGCDLRSQIYLAAAGGTFSFNRNVHRAAISSTGTGLGMSAGFAGDLEVYSCVFYDWADALINPSNTSASRRMRIYNTVFDNNGRGIVATGHIAAWQGAVLRGCSFSNHSGNALEAISGADAAVAQNDYNNFYANATNRVGLSAGGHDMAVNPSFRSPITGDFQASISLRGLGDHAFLVDGFGQLSPQSVDIGLQRREPIGGNITCTFIGVAQDEINVYAQFLTTGGERDGIVSAVVIPKAGIPSNDAPLEVALISNVQAFLRTNNPTDLIGRESQV